MELVLLETSSLRISHKKPAVHCRVMQQTLEVLLGHTHLVGEGHRDEKLQVVLVQFMS